MGILFGTAGLLMRNKLKHDQAGGTQGEYDYHERQEQEHYSLNFKSSHPSSTSATITPSPMHSSSPSKTTTAVTFAEPDDTESSDGMNPTIAVLQSHWQSVLLVSLVAAFWGCGYYSVFVWMAYFMTDPHLVGENSDNQQFLEKVAWGLIFFANLLLVVGLPLAGLLGDRSNHIPPIRNVRLFCRILQEWGR